MTDDMTDLETIHEFSAAGRHQECLQACHNVLDSYPEKVYAYKYAGKSLLALGQIEQAQQYLVKAYHLDGSDPEITKDIGNICLKLGNKDAALSWYEKALEINRNYAPAYNNIANIKRQLGYNKEAVDLFRQAIQVDPTMIQAYIGSAASFLALGDLDQAQSFAKQGLVIDKFTPGLNGILGIIFQDKSNPDLAIKYHQKELDISPQASNSLLNIGLLLLQKGETANAIEALEKASEILQNEQCSLLLAQAYYDFGRFNDALDEYKKMNPIQSTNKLIAFNLGLCLLKMGNNIDAIEAFQIAIKKDDDFIAAWGNLGIALQYERRYEEALSATLKILDIDPNNHAAYINLSIIYKHINSFEQALVPALKALMLKPYDHTTHMNLACIYKDLGNLDQALASTLNSLEINPENPDAHMNLGCIYKDLGNLDHAVASTIKSLELKSDSSQALQNLLDMYRDDDLQIIKTIVQESLNKNKDGLNNLDYIEGASSLGEKFFKDILNAQNY